jgi:hypothetical protein
MTATLKKPAKRNRPQKLAHPAEVICGRLEDLTEGSISVRYNPGAYRKSDPEAKGMLFYAHLDIDKHSEDDFANLDYRGPKSLGEQLADELTRISLMYLEIATRVRQNIVAETLAKL